MDTNIIQIVRDKWVLPSPEVPRRSFFEVEGYVFLRLEVGAVCLGRLDEDEKFPGDVDQWKVGDIRHFLPRHPPATMLALDGPMKFRFCKSPIQSRIKRAEFLK